MTSQMLLLHLLLPIRVQCCLWWTQPLFHFLLNVDVGDHSFTSTWTPKMLISTHSSSTLFLFLISSIPFTLPIKNASQSLMLAPYSTAFIFGLFLFKCHFVKYRNKTKNDVMSAEYFRIADIRGRIGSLGNGSGLLIGRTGSGMNLKVRRTEPNCC